MAKKKKAKEVEREIELGEGKKLIVYSDGTSEMVISFDESETEALTGGESEESEDDDDSEDEDETEDDDSDDDDGDEDDSDEIEVPSAEELLEMDFEELEDTVDDHEIDIDSDEFDEDTVEDFRAAIAKALKIKLPKPAGKKKKKK